MEKKWLRKREEAERKRLNVRGLLRLLVSVKKLLDRYSFSGYFRYLDLPFI